MRVTRNRILLMGCVSSALFCHAAERTASAKLKVAEAKPGIDTVGKATAKKDSRRGVWPPKAGIKTPGIQIPMASLVAEAEIALDGPADSILIGETLYAASKAKNSLVPVNTKTNKVEEAIADLKSPCSTIVSAFGSIWVPNCADQVIARVDAKKKKVTATVPAPVQELNRSIAATADSVWVLSDGKTTLSRIDPETNQIVAELRLPAGCNSILPAEGALWVTCPTEDLMLRVDPNTNLVAERIQVAGEPVASAFGESSVWVLCKTDGKVVRIDPKTNKLTTTVELKTPGIGGEIAFGEGFLWVSSPGFPITRIDPASDKVVQQFVGEGGGSVYLSSGAVWLPNYKPNMLSRFDPKRIKATLAE